MKQNVKLIFMLAISIFGFASNSLGQSTETIDEDQYQSEEPDEIVMIERESSIFDTLFIPAGKPIVFLIEVDENSSGMISEYSDLKNEEKELINNFGNNAFEIKVISKNTYVQFENKKVLNISWAINLYQAFAYWSGKLSDDIKVKHGAHFATEFVAEQMGVKKESSYVVNTRIYRSQMASLQNINNITKNSKIVMDAYLGNISSAWIESNQEQYSNLFLNKILKLKSLETYSDRDGSKIHVKTVSFNQKGQPTLIKLYSMNGEEEKSIQYTYENEMLSEITDNYGRIKTVQYENDQMIIIEKSQTDSEILIVNFVNNILFTKTYHIPKNDFQSFECSFSDEKYDNSCKFQYVNNVNSKRGCNSEIGVFPFTYEEIVFYESGQVSHSNSKIEKVDDKIFKIYFIHPDTDPEYTIQHWATLHLNENGLVSTFDLIDQNVIKVDYTYYP